LEKQQSLKRGENIPRVTLGALSVSKDMKDAKDILQWRQTFAFMLMRPFRGNTVIGKTVLLVEIGYQTIPAGSLVTNTTTTEVKK
jgi:hypothetical protein